MDYLGELLAPIGGVKVRRMFGGAGLFDGDVMFGIVADDVIYLKVTPGTRPEFIEARAAPFSYRTGQGRRALDSFMSLPEGLLDDADGFKAWISRAMREARIAKTSAKKKSPAKRGAAKGKPAAAEKAKSKSRVKGSRRSRRPER